MATMILYLHGFNSSPRSLKGLQLAAWLTHHLPDIVQAFPALPNTPAAAWQRITEVVEGALRDHGRDLTLGVVGSSLGGFMATRVSQHYGVRALLINPAVKPYQLLAHYLGPQHNPYSGESYHLLPHHIDELRALEIPLSAPELLWVMLQQGDEVLDYRSGAAHYQLARVTVEGGGNHSFIGFERHIPQIIEFLGG